MHCALKSEANRRCRVKRVWKILVKMKNVKHCAMNKNIMLYRGKIREILQIKIREILQIKIREILQIKIREIAK